MDQLVGEIYGWNQALPTKLAEFSCNKSFNQCFEQAGGKRLYIYIIIYIYIYIHIYIYLKPLHMSIRFILKEVSPQVFLKKLLGGSRNRGG